MLGRFSTVLQNACDALAPPAPLHEDFAYHWKKLMKHYLDVSTKKQLPIELTNIPVHFDQLLKILIREDEEKAGSGEMGPCLEYLLQHSLLDLLATLAASDDPPGMRQHVLHFVAKLLTQLKAPIAGHTSVYPSLQRLVGLCDGSTPTPTEGMEVQFLLGLTALVRRNPQLVSVFTTNQSESSKGDLRRGSWSSDASSQFSCVTSTSTDVSPPVNNPLFCTPLATSSRGRALRIVPVVPAPTSPEDGYESSSEENKSQHSNEALSHDELPILDALLSYIDTADSKLRVKVCHGLMLLVSFPDEKMAATVVSETMLCSRLASRLTQLALDIPDSTEPNHIDDMHVSWGLDSSTSVCITCDGCRQVASFLSWFDFCDQVMVESHSVVGEAVGKAIHERFLNEVFTLEALKNTINITILTKCFRSASSTIFNNVLCNWLGGGKVEKEVAGFKKASVKQTLLDNWTSDNSQLALETLRLFEVVLEKGNDHVMECLVYVYLDDRGYIDHEASKETVEENGLDHADAKAKRIQTIINTFLNVVPYELRSTSEPHIGYEQYICESQRQYSALMNSCRHSKWSKSDNPAQAQQSLFYEGPFLRTLFDSIRNIPNQEYEINLELTAVVSRLALIPNGVLHEFLLESCVLCLRPEVTTLLSSLSHVAVLLADAVSSKPNYKQTLAHTRAHLLGHTSPDLSEDEWSSAYESVVVVEELCKELSAIAYVKQKHSSS